VSSRVSSRVVRAEARRTGGDRVDIRVKVSRRSCLLGTVASALSMHKARADRPSPMPRDFDVRDFTVEGDPALGRRFTLCVPNHLAQGQKVPLLVLLHGLAETSDERLGVYAWIDRYGLPGAYERLRRPPVVRTSPRPDYGDERLAKVNAALVARPFAGLVMACPYTPNIWRNANPSANLDRYAGWLADVVVPRARSEARVVSAHVSIDGCSLGGYVALEAFLRKPELFAAWGGIQSAIGENSAGTQADRIAAAISRVGARPLHIETSEADPYRRGNVALSENLRQRGVPNDQLVLPGPHDQPFLREAGTLEMLLWHDRLQDFGLNRDPPH
jgi:poly(3-hydroxybutyrate) depolymerase